MWKYMNNIYNVLTVKPPASPGWPAIRSDTSASHGLMAAWLA